MPHTLWFLFRLALIIWFFGGGWTMAKSLPDVSASSPLIAIVCLMAFFPAWRFYSILSAQKKEARGGSDWRASLWFSPILKNPQSWVMISGAALGACGGAMVIQSIVAGRGAFVGLFVLTFAVGILAGLIAFRIRHEKTA